MGLAIIAVCLQKGEANYRRHWLILALIFAYLSMDETSVIHEMTIRPLRYGSDFNSALYYSWVIPAAVLLAVFLFGYFGFLRHFASQQLQLFYPDRTGFRGPDLVERILHRLLGDHRG